MPSTPPQARSPHRLADQLGPIRIRPDVRLALEQQAAQAGRSLSDFVRAILTREAAILPRSSAETISK